MGTRVGSWNWGNADWSCPLGYRMPNSGEWSRVVPCLNGWTSSYYHGVAYAVGGCSCKWNGGWCGASSIETFDQGRLCGDFYAKFICVSQVASRRLLSDSQTEAGYSLNATEALLYQTALLANSERPSIAPPVVTLPAYFSSSKLCQTSNATFSTAATSDCYPIQDFSLEEVQALLTTLSPAAI
jgi:hypothetical protein